MTTIVAPSTPSRRTRSYAEGDEIVRHLSRRWGLELELPKDGESPSKRKEKRTMAPNPQLAERRHHCVHIINFLCLKNMAALRKAVSGFETNATLLYNEWVNKPKGDPDTLPVTGREHPPVTATQAQVLALLECLYQNLQLEFAQEKNAQSIQHAQRSVNSARSFQDANLSVEGNPPVSLLDAESGVVPLTINDDPIPFNVGISRSGKRLSDGVQTNDGFKKPRRPLGEDDFSRSFIGSVGFGPVNSHKPISPSQGSFAVSNRSAETSFSSIFSRRPEESFTSNTTFPSSNGMSREAEVIPMHVRPPDDSQSTHYGSSPDYMYEEVATTSLAKQVEVDIEDKLIDESDDPLESSLRKSLNNVFPELPKCLEAAPLCVRYEITRVCLHAQTPVIAEIPPLSRMRKYDSLWNFLKQHPQLQGKPFPEKSSLKAWEACLTTYKSGLSNGVTLSGSLTFSESPEGIFDFRLKPLSLEITNRLGRRFGNDRFIDITLPSLSGKKLPKLLRDTGVKSQQVILRWMLHEIRVLGRTWKPFYIKNSRAKKTKISIFDTVQVDNTTNFYMTLFAADGNDFQNQKTIPHKGENPNMHTRMTVTAMLNWLIPLQDNAKQPFLKLFSRIALGLSKTYATLVLQESQVIDKEDLMSADGKEIMNDGCGRISSAMAMMVAQHLKLTYLPSGFQARIGGAKGFWIVASNKDTKPWIEIYPSQRKWDRNAYGLDPSDKDHRIFEVVAWVKPLRSASLNLQLLPLLEDRGKSAGAMRGSIAKLLEQRLSREIEEQKAAMDSPQSFRIWLSDSRTRMTEDRLKYGEVRYDAGLPSTREERINLLLDAGFDPKQLFYLKDLAWKAYADHCNQLREKLNVTVGRSTYAFIAIDFSGILEPNEVHLGFSNSFTDDLSEWSETVLDGEEILVARIPAHYVSDIQKVKAVWKRELKHLKDVAVFSCRGDFPLAKKLSGGDYDGDKAWICWEPTLVREFQNADIPECPDLVKLGHITKDKTRYSDLTRQSSNDPVPIFLEKSFEFSLRDNLLGMCTLFKEHYCYTVNNMRQYEAVFLSTLLSSLVDQSKQGLTFTRESWEDIKKTIIQTKPVIPAYKGTNFGGKKVSHIIDYLKFVVAEKTINSTLISFHNSLQDVQTWDADLVKYAAYAKQRAEASPDWSSLLERLELDIAAIKKEWLDTFARKQDEDSFDLDAFKPTIRSLYGKYNAIRPDATNSLSAVLLPACFNEDFSEWSLLKASVTFKSHYNSTFVWWMAAKQLAYLKARANKGPGEGSEGVGIGSFNVLTPTMYTMLKPNKKIVKHIQSEEHDPGFWEISAESQCGDWEETVD